MKLAAGTLGPCSSQALGSAVPLQLRTSVPGKDGGLLHAMPGWRIRPTTSQLRIYKDSRFFCLFQFHKMQAAVMTRRMARSPTNPEKMLLLGSLSLGGKPSAMLRWLWGGGEVGGENVSFRS